MYGLPKEARVPSVATTEEGASVLVIRLEEEEKFDLIYFVSSTMRVVSRKLKQVVIWQVMSLGLPKWG